MKKRTVLVVDDEEPMLRTFRCALGELDVEVLTCAYSGEGSEVLAGGGVDVIICDRRLPGMSGFQFLDLARQSAPDAIRIIMSGYFEKGEVAAATADGTVFAALHKPFGDQQVLSLVERAIHYKALSEFCRSEPINPRVTSAHRRARCGRPGLQIDAGNGAA